MKYYGERNLKLYRDYNNQNKKGSEEPAPVKNQQFFPGGFPGRPPQPPGQMRPQPGQRPQVGPPPGQMGPQPGQTAPQPGQLRAPMSAPPNFTPELPSAEREQLQAPFGAPQFAPRRPRNLRSCLNRFTYIWLVNGNSFWFFPVFLSGQQVVGFRWRRGSWVFDRISTRRILFHQCF